MSRLAERTPVRPAPRSVWKAGWPVIVVGLALVLAYVLVYPLFDLRVTIGSDAPVYVWWARVGGALGMGPLGTGARPGSVGLVATLARVTPAPATVVVAAAIPALAAATGLAAGAFSELSLGADRARFLLVSVFAGSYLTLLADGYLSTFAFLTAFIAALACMAASLRPMDDGDDGDDSTSVAAVVLGGVLILAAGLGHPLFLVLAGGVMLGGIVGILPVAIRAAQSGTPFWSTGAARVGTAGLVGAVLVPGGLALSGGFARSSVVTSRDAILRSTGRASVLRSSYVRKLTHDFPWYRVVLVLGLAATPLLARPDAGRAWSTERARFLWGAAIAWVAVAVGGVLLLVAGISTPGQRLAATCIAFPLLAGVGLAAMWRRPSAGAWRMAVAACAVLFVVLAWSRWLGERPLDSPAVLTGARQAALALAGAPPGTPLVVVMDDRSTSPTIHVVRYLNDLRGAVAPEQAGRVFVFLGTPEDFLNFRPTITGRPEHDTYSQSSLAAIMRLRTRPLAVVVRAFDPASFRRALSITSARQIQPGLVALPTSAPTGANRLSDAAGGGGPQSPWEPVWEAVLLLAIAGAVGWPYTALAPNATPQTRWALAPAVGFAALMLAAVLVDGLGVRLSDAGGWLALGLAVVPGWSLLSRRSARVRNGRVPKAG